MIRTEPLTDYQWLIEAAKEFEKAVDSHTIMDTLGGISCINISDILALEYAHRLRDIAYNMKEKKKWKRES